MESVHICIHGVNSTSSDPWSPSSYSSDMLRIHKFVDRQGVPIHEDDPSLHPFRSFMSWLKTLDSDDFEVQSISIRSWRWSLVLAKNATSCIMQPDHSGHRWVHDPSSASFSWSLSSLYFVSFFFLHDNLNWRMIFSLGFPNMNRKIIKHLPQVSSSLSLAQETIGEKTRSSCCLIL